MIKKLNFLQNKWFRTYVLFSLTKLKKLINKKEKD